MVFLDNYKYCTWLVWSWNLTWGEIWVRGALLFCLQLCFISTLEWNFQNGHIFPRVKSTLCLHFIGVYVDKGLAFFHPGLKFWLFLKTFVNSCRVRKQRKITAMEIYLSIVSFHHSDFHRYFEPCSCSCSIKVENALSWKRPQVFSLQNRWTNQEVKL